jgi:hypothetical protein
VCGASLGYLGGKPSTPELRVQCEADLDLAGTLERQVPQNCTPDELGPTPLPEYPDAEPVFHPVLEVSGEVLGRLLLIPDAAEFGHDVRIAVKLDQIGQVIRRYPLCFKARCSERLGNRHRDSNAPTLPNG